jgi:hypothetical protein
VYLKVFFNGFSIYESWVCMLMIFVCFLAGVAIMIEWKERENELNDHASMGDLQTLDALRDCVLLKFFLCQSMRAQPVDIMVAAGGIYL